MLNVQPVTLTDGRIRLEPMALAHVDALKAAAADGQLWNIRVTSVPDPDDTRGYVERALAMRAQGNRLPFVVVDLENHDRIIGSTSYHDIVPAIDRLEIGWTWYAKSTQRSHVNTCAKLLLLVHAFETLNAKLVGWRTDNYNFASQKAIERLGARKDGVLRHHAVRRDGTVRDTVMYSLTAGEWPEVKAHLLHQQNKPRS
ncbi:GNAT family N-acetyltransferase [Scleromatobacter humisilvae]|uniref:GNAT family N-acetyltransferase n=1 Tax=Scleromatobacter humisilvae TaxID=2897159 RepID=A0A9X2BZY6_9BURK|nr:GNAT family protein [Scleromatobacter humisilvae]MCK9684154.1 GNAT family N-acetyltransferase [Scleromatobacter humisilvae]